MGGPPLKAHTVVSVMTDWTANNAFSPLHGAADDPQHRCDHLKEMT